MVERRLSDGSIAYYWRVRAKDRVAGFPIDCEVLGTDYATAVDQAKMLNTHYDSLRQGRHLRRRHPSDDPSRKHRRRTMLGTFADNPAAMA